MSGRWKEFSDVFQNLIDAGCDIDMVEDFFTLQLAQNQSGQVNLLRRHRKALLDKLHESQRAIDCLDELLCHMKNKASPKR